MPEDMPDAPPMEADATMEDTGWSKAGARSSFRGHPTRWDEDAEMWRYEDDGSPLPGWGGEIRPCVVCGAEHELHEPDPCLGTLPGVNNACCGHGNPEKAYVWFTNGVVLEGFKIRSKAGEMWAPIPFMTPE